MPSTSTRTTLSSIGTRVWSWTMSETGFFSEKSNPTPTSRNTFSQSQHPSRMVLAERSPTCTIWRLVNFCDAEVSFCAFIWLCCMFFYVGRKRRMNEKGREVMMFCPDFEPGTQQLHPTTGPVDASHFGWFSGFIVWHHRALSHVPLYRCLLE